MQVERGFAGLAEGADGEGERGDEAAEVDDVIERDCGVPAVAQVGEDGVVEAVVGLGVAENAVVHAAVEGVEDAGSGQEIHIGHPEGIEFGAAVVFDAAGAAARDGRVEVESHRGVSRGGRAGLQAGIAE